jgi:hypothetical protein
MEIIVEKFPITTDEFVAIRDKIAISPEGGAAVFALALAVYGSDQELGLACLTISADKSRLTNGNAYKGFTIIASDLSLLKMQLDKALYIGNSYVQGTSAANGYTLPSGSLKYDISENPYSGDKASGRYKVFVRCTGADTPRPISLQVNDKGLWKAIEWSSLIVGIKAPPKKESDDL